MPVYSATAPPLQTSVQITGGAGPVGPIWANIATVTIPDLAVGEPLLVGLDVESTIPSALTYNVAVTTQVVAGTAVGQAGEYVIRAAAENNTPTVHHQVMSRTALFVVDSPARKVFTLMLAADSDVAGANDTYVIETLSTQCLLWVVRLGPLDY